LSLWEVRTGRAVHTYSHHSAAAVVITVGDAVGATVGELCAGTWWGWVSAQG